MSIILIFTQTVIIIYFAATNDFPDYDGVDVLPFGSSQPWNKYIAAISVFLYSFCPMFVAVEVASGMEQPEGIRRALVISYLFPALLVYCPTGVVIPLLWGANVPNPVTSAMGNGPLAGVTNGMLLYSTLLDFVVAATTVNGVAQRMMFPGFDGVLNVRNLPRWLVITFPSLIIALSLALFVPELDSLVGLLTFLCVPVVMLFAPAGMLLRLRHTPAGAEPESLPARIASIAASSKYLLALGVIVGVPFVPAILAETIYSVAQLQLNGHYWCSSVGE